MQHDTAILTPAYGRDYYCAADAERDFFGGRDFKIQPSGQYCSIRDLALYKRAQIRYHRLREVTVVCLIEDGK